MNAPSLHAPPGLSNYRMLERTGHPDFGIRDQNMALPNLAPHRHQYYQIHIQLHGHTRHFLGSVSRPVGPGTICFILPYKTHFIPTLPDSQYYILNISHSFLFPGWDVDILSLEEVPAQRAPELAPFLAQEHIDFTLDQAGIEKAHKLCQAIQQEDTERSIASSILVKGYVLQLIAMIWQRYDENIRHITQSNQGAAGNRRTLQRVMRYIRSNLTKPLSLQETADAIHLSPSYLARLIKNETGQTFTDLVNERRIKFAKELLIHTDMNIKEIAFHTGFNDTSYFGRLFRKLVGCSASTLRKNVYVASREAEKSK